MHKLETSTDQIHQEAVIEIRSSKCQFDAHPMMEPATNPFIESTGCAGQRHALVMSHHLVHYKKGAKVLTIRKVLTKNTYHDHNYLTICI